MQISKIKYLAREIEIGLILTWLLFYPRKESPLYFLILAALLLFFSLLRIRSNKNIVLYRFSYFLLAFNLVYFAAVAFSRFPYKSLLFVADILLISLYYFFFYLEKQDFHRLAFVAAAVLSLASLLNVATYVLLGGRQTSLLFKNPILQGIASSLALLIIFFQWLEKRYVWLWLPGAINFSALILSASKAAFLGLLLLAVYMLLLQGRKAWVATVLLILLLLLLIPNPMRRAFVQGWRQDPFVFDRLSIWQMALRMIRDHLPVGIGPDLFWETARRYNFAQTHGVAHYDKVPESPHSDYLKLVSDTGVAGLLFLLLALFLILKRLFVPPRWDLAKLLLAFLLLQMLMFNFVFHVFYLFLIILLFKMVFEDRPLFASFTPIGKTALVLFALGFWVMLYLLPWVSSRWSALAQRKDAVTAFGCLTRAERLDPLNPRLPYAKALLLFAYFQKRGDVGAWTGSLRQSQRAQRLDRQFVDAAILESNLYLSLLGHRLKYPALLSEVIAPLERAEAWDPFNPFIKLKKALVYFDFSEKEMARREALRALELEPEFVSALYFLQEKFNHFANPDVFRSTIERIHRKSQRLRLQPGSYLFNLFQIPAPSRPPR